MLSQISVTDMTPLLTSYVTSSPSIAGQCPSPPCPWDGCVAVSWDTRLQQPTGLATEQSRSQSGGLRGAFSRNEFIAARYVASTIWKNDRLKSGVVLIRTEHWQSSESVVWSTA